MSLPAIREQLAIIIKATPAVTVKGETVRIAEALAYEPQMPPEIVPCAYLGDAAGEINGGSLEVWDYALPLHVVMHEAGYAEMERLTVESFMLEVVKKLRGNTSANDTAAVVYVSAFEQGTITLQDKPYRGFTLTLSVEEKFEVANQYAP